LANKVKDKDKDLANKVKVKVLASKDKAQM